MSGKSLKFGDKKVNKGNFYKSKKLFKIDDIDVNKILISKKNLILRKKYSFKYFIGYNDNDETKPLFIRLPQMIGYAKFFDNAKTMPFKANHKKLLKSYNKTWESISCLIGKEVDSKVYYGDNINYINTKIKIVRENVCINFYGKLMQKKPLAYKCLSLIMVDFVIKISNKYYSKILLKECKYKAKYYKTECNINYDFDAGLI